MSLLTPVMNDYTNILEVVKDKISFDSGSAIQRGRSTRGELSLDSISPFAFIDSVGGSPHALLCPPIDHCMVDDAFPGYSAFAKINSPPLAEDVISVLKRENFTVSDVNKLNSERLVKDRNNSNKPLKKNSKVKYHKHCGKWTLCATNGGKYYLSRYRCGSWRCKRCSVDLAQKQFRKIQESLESMKYSVFLTLTFDGKELTNDEAEEKEGKIWNILKIYLERKFGKFEYYWTREWQANTKMLHKHILITANKSLWDGCAGVFGESDARREMRRKTGQYYEIKRWLNEVVVGRGYGKICDLARPRSNDAVIKYIVSEITKTNQKKDDYRRNLRMYGSSRNFFTKVEKPEREKMEVFIIKGTIETVKECLEHNGFKTKNMKDDIVFSKNEDGKIEAVGSELGSFEIE